MFIFGMLLRFQSPREAVDLWCLVSWRCSLMCHGWIDSGCRDGNCRIWSRSRDLVYCVLKSVVVKSRASSTYGILEGVGWLTKDCMLVARGCGVRRLWLKDVMGGKQVEIQMIWQRYIAEQELICGGIALGSLISLPRHLGAALRPQTTGCWRACVIKSCESLFRLGRRWQKRDALFEHQQPVRRRGPPQPQHGNNRYDELIILHQEIYHLSTPRRLSRFHATI